MKQFILIAALCFFAVQPASAQFGKLLNKALERKTQEKMDKEVEKALDKVFSDSLSVKNQNGKTVIDTPESEITIEEDKSTTPSNVDPSKFIGSYTTTTTLSQNGKQDDPPIKMHIFVDSYQVAMIMEDEKDKGEPMSRIIFDRRDRTMTNLTDDKDEKVGVKMKMPKTSVKNKGGDKIASTTTAAANKPIRTGKTKQINGYTCNQYTMADEKYDHEFWVAESIDIDPAILLEAMNMSGGKSKAQDYNSNFTKGIAMETIMHDKKSKNNETITITISNFVMGKVDKSKFNTEGYKIQDMSSMNMFDRSTFGK